MSTLIRRWRTAFGFLLLFLLWEVGVHVFAVHEYILPPPSQVLRALIKNWQPVLANRPRITPSSGNDASRAWRTGHADGFGQPRHGHCHPLCRR